MPVAKKLYKELSAKLEPIGLLTEVDGQALAGYCQAYARWKEAEEFLAKAKTTVTKTKSGYLMPLPQVAIAQKSLELMAKLGAKFGLSPADRVGLGVKPREQKSKFQAYLEKGKAKSAKQAGQA
jgi:P27 family predicted phage terminase small subunit